MTRDTRHMATRQVLSVRHPQKGTLELGFTIVVPPGRLGQFTKVVQFWPRLLVVNRLPRALVLEQNLTLRYGSRAELDRQMSRLVFSPAV